MSSANSSFELIDEPAKELKLWTDDNVLRYFESIKPNGPGDNDASELASAEKEDGLSYNDNCGEKDHDVDKKFMGELKEAQDSLKQEKEKHLKTMTYLQKTETNLLKMSLMYMEMKWNANNLEKKSSDAEKQQREGKVDMEKLRGELEMVYNLLENEKKMHRETIAKLQQTEAAKSSVQNQMKVMNEMLEKCEAQDELKELRKEN